MSNIIKELENGQYVVKGVTLSYPFLAQPQPNKDGDGPEKYSAAFVIPEGADFTILLQRIVEVGKEKFGKDAAKKLKAGGPLRNPIRDGEFKYGEGTWFFNARSKRQPGLVTNVPDPRNGGKPMRVPPEDITEVFYPGAIVNVIVSVYAYNRPENKGVSLGLEAVQKVADAPRLDSRVSAVDAFDADPDALVGFEDDEELVGTSADEANADVEDEEDELAGLLG